jgi:hypothetical protein
VIGAAARRGADKGEQGEAVDNAVHSGVIFFVIVVGLVDAGLPWPVPKGCSR